MSEFTLPAHSGVDAAGRYGRVATIEDVCCLAIRAASTTRAHSSRTDPAVTGVVRSPMVTAGTFHPTRLDTVTAR